MYDNDLSVTLGCGTMINLKELDDAGISYIPCGKDLTPNAKYAHLRGKSTHIGVKKFEEIGYTRKWWENEVHGIFILTGSESVKGSGAKKHFIADVDIERRMIDKYRPVTEKIYRHYIANAEGDPCVVETKSGGIRLSCWVKWCGHKVQFRDDGGMLVEFFSLKGMSRYNSLYKMIVGHPKNPPILNKSVLADIHRMITPLCSNKPGTGKPPKNVGIDAVADIGKVEWEVYPRKNSVKVSSNPVKCPVTAHEHDDTRPATYLFKNSNGVIAYKCFKCGAKGKIR